MDKIEQIKHAKLCYMSSENEKAVRCQCLQEATCAHAVVLRTTVVDQQVEPLLRLFWELESIGASDISINASDVDLWENFTKALKVADGSRLSRAPALMNEYDAEMRRLVAEGIAEIVPDEVSNGGRYIYHIPHQPVLRESSSPTKLRIVFDASLHGAEAKSLNENLESGLNLNPDLARLLLNFRRHRIALIADVEKALLQVRVAPMDRDSFDRSPEVDKPLCKAAVLRMIRVPFGVTSSPFLLAATLRHHLENVKDKYP